MAILDLDPLTMPSARRTRPQSVIVPAMKINVIKLMMRLTASVRKKSTARAAPRIVRIIPGTTILALMVDHSENYVLFQPIDCHECSV